MENKGWAIVTGASAGIGDAFARTLAKRGHPVLLVARRRERLEALAKAITDGGGRAEVLAADLERAESCAIIAERAAQLGDLELLVNNAGFGDHGPALEQPVARHRAVIDVNVSSLVDLTMRILPLLLARGRGGVIQVASTAAFQPVPFMTTYAATKAFVLSFTEGLSVELRGRGVRVMAICPGPTESEFFHGDTAILDRAPSLMTAQELVDVALAGWDGGRVVKIAGFLNAVGAWLSQLAPRALVRRISGYLFRPVAKKS